MNQFGKILLSALIMAAFVAVDEVVRSNVRKFIKDRFFDGGTPSSDDELHRSTYCCGGGCR